MAKLDPTGDMFKRFERDSSPVLERGQFVGIRVDGRAFHTYLRNARKPFDTDVMGAMAAAAAALFDQVQGSLVGYTQSDEISIVASGGFAPQSEVWFGGKTQKIASISASVVTSAFTKAIGDRFLGTPLFDARVFGLPDATTALRYLHWRQMDALRNSISMMAQSEFSHKDLQGKSKIDMMLMLAERGIDVETDYPAGARAGIAVRRFQKLENISYTDKRDQQVYQEDVTRRVTVVEEAPSFHAAEYTWASEALVDAWSARVVGSEA